LSHPQTSWEILAGQHWAIVGPNGSGKTTLLSLITGDHPQAYANEIYLFGKRRGSGESIWDVKARIGMISSEFQARYRNEIMTYEVVATGLFDSVGLYRKLTTQQYQRVHRWIQFFRLSLCDPLSG
jgi:molybdate transport system ATP-binding protein